MAIDGYRRADAAARRKAAQHESALRNAYHKALRALGLSAADRFGDSATSHGAGSWSLPAAEEVYPLAAAVAVLSTATRRVKERIVTTLLRDLEPRIGVSFDVSNPLLEHTIERLGQNIGHIAEDHRRAIMRALQHAYGEGLSIPDAAKALRADAPGIAASRAELIARTELSGAVNAGSLAAAWISGAAAYKVWLATEDDRTRPAHAAADYQVVPIDQPFVVAGWPMMYPGDQSAPPELTARCRCTLTYQDSLADVLEADSQETP